MTKTTASVLTVAVAGSVLTAFAQTPPPQGPPAQSQPAQGPAAGREGRRGGGQQPMPPGPNPNSQYRLGPDSMPQEGVPKGEIRGPYTLPSNVYPGTQHTYWVYVPAQYDPAVPASLMVFQDGQAFKDEKGDLRAQNVQPVGCGVSRFAENHPKGARQGSSRFVAAAWPGFPPQGHGRERDQPLAATDSGHRGPGPLERPADRASDIVQRGTGIRLLLFIHRTCRSIGVRDCACRRGRRRPIP